MMFWKMRFFWKNNVSFVETIILLGKVNNLLVVYITEKSLLYWEKELFTLEKQYLYSKIIDLLRDNKFSYF